MTHPSAFLNDHSWYTLSGPWDWARAVLWTGANIVTGICYFAIPLEMLRWEAAIPLMSVKRFVLLYFGFILACGSSHFAMAMVMQTAPWWAVLIYVSMAVVSCLALVEMYLRRAAILLALQALFAAYRDGR